MPCPWPGRVSGRPADSRRVWKNRRPEGGFLPWLPERPRRQLEPLVDLFLGGVRHQLVEEPAHLAYVARRFGQALLAGVEFLEHVHGQVDVVLLEAEHRGGIVHQDVRVEHERASGTLGRPVLQHSRQSSLAASRTSAAWPLTRTLRHSRRIAALAVDQEGAALDAHHLAAVHVLLLPDAEQRGDRVVLVRAQLERELQLVPEPGVRLQRVGRDAEDAGPRPAEGRGEIAEVAALERAAGRVVARVEVDDEILAALVAEPEHPARGRDRELRRLRRGLAARHRLSSSPVRGWRRGSSGRRSP